MSDKKFYALRDSDFEKERNEIILKWLQVQINWKLSLLKLVQEEVEKHGLKDKLGLGGTDND